MYGEGVKTKCVGKTVKAKCNMGKGLQYIYMSVGKGLKQNVIWGRGYKMYIGRVKTKKCGEGVKTKCLWERVKRKCIWRKGSNKLYVERVKTKCVRKGLK